MLRYTFLITSVFVLHSTLKAQPKVNKNHNFYFQKVVVNSEECEVLATRIFDSLNVFGYISGYDPLQIKRLQWGGKFGNSDEFENAVFNEVKSNDTVELVFNTFLIPEIQKSISEATINHAFILFGNIVVGGLWLYDLYFTEILNTAGIEFTDRTQVLCIDPWKTKKYLHYRIVAINKSEDSRYFINYVYLNYTNPLNPIIEKSERKEITNEKIINKLKKQISDTRSIDFKNQCPSPEIPTLTALKDKQFFYSIECLNRHRHEFDMQPLNLFFFVNRLFQKQF